MIRGGRGHRSNYPFCEEVTNGAIRLSLTIDKEFSTNMLWASSVRIQEDLESRRTVQVVRVKTKHETEWEQKWDIINNKSWGASHFWVRTNWSKLDMQTEWEEKREQEWDKLQVGRRNVRRTRQANFQSNPVMLGSLGENLPNNDVYNSSSPSCWLVLLTHEPAERHNEFLQKWQEEQP